jgi:hypothetical protein
MRISFVCIWIPIVFVVAACVERDEYPVFKGPYLGQEPPGLTPQVFAPEILSKTQPDWAFDATFAPGGNEFYFTRFDRDQDLNTIMRMQKVNGTWTRPAAVSFNSQENNNNLSISPDGNRIFFRSWRPLPGSSKPETQPFLWFVQRTKKGWSKPQSVKCGDGYYRASHPGVARNGTLYFAHRSEKTLGQSDIYRSRWVNGSYTAPEKLGGDINTEYLEGDLYVAPDESYIIVTCWDRPDNLGESDLYISYRRPDDSWTALENLGAPINTKNNENCATVTPDGKYFFYLGVDVDGETPRCSTYWVDAEILDRYRPAELKSIQ